MIDALSQDLRFALRQLRRSRAFTTVAIVTLPNLSKILFPYFSSGRNLLWRQFESTDARGEIDDPV
jgi:hypothetical protein